MSGQDDGTREYAVRELGEDAVRALEVEFVKTEADRLSPRAFEAMGIPTASILEGLKAGTPAPTRPENDGLSVRARGRLDQAVARSKGRITYRRPVTGAAGEVSVQIEASPADGQEAPQAKPAAVKLTRHSDDHVSLQLNNHERPVPGTDEQAAAALGIDLEAWMHSRRSIELGLSAVAGQRPALRPPDASVARPEDRAAHAPRIGIGQQGAAR
jgi:hypothetical protein